MASNPRVSYRMGGFAALGLVREGEVMEVKTRRMRGKRLVRYRWDLRPTTILE